MIMVRAAERIYNTTIFLIVILAPYSAAQLPPPHDIVRHATYSQAVIERTMHYEL